jgi:hypothetical protein
MAMAADDFTPTADEWTVDKAFQYLHVIGLPNELAIYQLLEALRAGRLRMTARIFADGIFHGREIVKTSYWYHDLDLVIDDGHALVRAHGPIGGLFERGLMVHWALGPPVEAIFTLPAEDVRRLGQSLSTAADTTTAAARRDQLIKQLADDEFPGGYARIRTNMLTQRVSRRFEQQMKEPAPSRYVLERALGRRTN